MTTEDHPIPKPKMVIRKGSEQCLAIRYAELLRLRQEVRQAEGQARGTILIRANRSRKLTCSLKSVQ